MAVVAAVSLAACGGGGDGDGGKGGKRDIEAVVRTDPPSVISATKTECHFDGDRQVLASGVVTNVGDDEHHVNIEVRFLDADDVRIDLMTDSVSSLELGESARWNVSFYPDRPADVVKCEVATTAS